jgi:electron transfer flavoprotein alpha subunit
VESNSIFGGTTIVRTRLSGVGPAIFIVRSKSVVPEPVGSGSAELVWQPVPDLGSTDGARVVANHVEAQTGPRLDAAAVVVSGGRGLGEASQYRMIEELASALGGAPGASRAIVDAGWVPYSHQIGQTGQTVKAEVYLAFGISGATQHIVGMKDSKTIIAVNRDPDAPILRIADLAVVGDATALLPRLITAVRAHR